MVVYCASGYRSLIAASVLADAGFVDVSDLLGGYGAWEGAGLPTSTGDAASDVGATPQVGARAAKALVDAGALLLDVREPDEWHGRACAEGDAHADGTGTRHDSGRASRRPQDRRRVPLRRALGGRHRRRFARGASMPSTSPVGMCAWAAAGLPVATTRPTAAGLVVHRDEPLNCETSIPAL